MCALTESSDSHALLMPNYITPAEQIVERVLNQHNFTVCSVMQFISRKF